MIIRSFFFMSVAMIGFGCSSNPDKTDETTNLLQRPFEQPFPSTQEQRILFSEAFKESTFGVGDSYFIQIPPDAVLVFDGKEDYYLNGNPLVIVGKRAVIEKTTKIISFKAESVPEPILGTPEAKLQAIGAVDCGRRGGNGCEGKQGATGETGAPGKPGRKGSDLSILIDEISQINGAKLILQATGQKGGKGQQGGQGGQGAEGGHGESENAWPDCAGPWIGGKGGQGGDPGLGGQGGKGGHGGTVILGPTLYQLWQEKSPMIEVSVEGGHGGDPGKSGEQALGGLGQKYGICTDQCPGCPHGRNKFGDKGNKEPLYLPVQSENGCKGIVISVGQTMPKKPTPCSAEEESAFWRKRFEEIFVPISGKK